ncbi:MAG: hypothetical protein KKG75_01100, partial [Nanoarchaeota archaeon]|nr:hypothetical protein [Nanoarchaeota archaeon]
MFKKTILLFTIALLLVSNAYALTVSNPVASSKDLPDADFDNDNRVDFDDFFLLTEAFGTDNYLFDLNGDDIVDDKDLTLFQEHFGEIYGCTDSTATNYNSEANTDNGSCKYPAPKPTPILGCTDSTALNYNPAVTQNDGSCQYQQPPAPQPITPKDADFDNDGDVDFDDFFLFSDNFGTNVAKYDLNKDGKVDFDDFFIFADNFGQKVLPTSADFDNNGVVNMTDFELFVQKFGTNIAEYDLNKDGKVDFDDFFIFADNFGQTVVLPEIQVLLSNPSPADNAEGVNSASRTFSFYSLVTPGGRVTYELYLSNAGTWPGNSMSIKNLENLNGKTPFGSITSSESRPNILVKNLNEYTVYYWRIKAIDSSGKVYLSPVWKFFTHNAGSSPENEFVALSENKLPTAQIQKPEEGYRNGKESYIKFSGIGNDADGVIISYEWLIDSIMHYKGQDKSNVVAYFYQSGDYLVNFRVQDDKGAWSKWTTLDIKIVENYAPNIPSNPSPGNGSKITSSYFTFSWDGGDKDNEDVTYNLIISKNPEFTWIQKTTKFT